ncbi:glucuronyl hydrolase [Sporothrix schenckii 1099-18]|uniref:Glucuronyl hydrolase n=1 Tax=Sporothrix schenckii 1099-18 TaxID=1397361 RepID=A0A0F2MCD2_SPOSC|nr:glucuronyl hydrolase [Sporothrix schenckii 1099-18]KJR85821.1 glucuronyl hydrolase [Sporothrix schenckii 1099-18]
MPSSASTTSSEGAGGAHSDNTSDSSVDGTPDIMDRPSVKPIAASTPTGLSMAPPLAERLSGLFAENTMAKITRTAVEALVDNDPPTRYPEYVPVTGPGAGQYALREADFWTCGFFPGSIYLLLERFNKFPQVVAPHLSPALRRRVQTTLETTAQSWDGPIRSMAGRTDTHDMAFIVMLSQRACFEQYHAPAARAAVVQAAYALHGRFHATVGAIRSWDRLDQDGVLVDSLADDFLVIVDSMVNLDLLYHVAALVGDDTLAAAATAHANTVLGSILRDEASTTPSDDGRPMYSTFHVANFSPATGAVKELRTAQGYARDSTWARGQAWGILGFARTFLRTGQPQFARAAAGLANYFLHRLATSPACVEVEVGDHGRKRGRLVPLWDFDAPVDPHAVADTGPLRDSSAGVIAANGMLVLSQALRARGQTQEADRFLQAALAIVEDTLALSLAPETAEFVEEEEEKAESAAWAVVKDTHAGQSFAAILKHATANANARDHHRYWNHGLVYADYYLLEFGNQLLRMGLA